MNRNPGMKHRNIILVLLTASVLISCRVNYSFTGASISPNTKTIAIPYFQNNASFVEPTLSRTLTDGLRDYFTTQTNLEQVKSGGDLDLQGTITEYSIVPQAIQGNETAALNRLRITVSVKFTNRNEPKQNFENTFSRFADYSSSEPLTPALQSALIKDITDQLVQDIFNKSVVNW
jgi:hypothetical protein